jgi:hypothetical protein
MKLALVLALAVPLAAGTSGSSHRKDFAVELARHRARQAKRPQTDAARATGVAAVLPDQGNIAVVDDTDGVVQGAGFDLDQKTLEFRPQGANATAYTYTAGALRFDQEAARAGTAVRLEDDDAKEAPLPFSFPFFGRRYDSVFIHSDGNVTFGQEEKSSDPRDMVRLVTGPPRAAAFFVDLDPSQPDAAVRYVSDRARFLITWNNVPYYADRPGPTVPRLTFQLALYPDGRLEAAYRRIEASQSAVGPDQPLGVVGLAPGGATRIDQVTFVDFSEASANPVSNALVEEFSSEEDFDRMALAKKFFRNHEDVYDFLVVFNAGQRQFSECADAIVIRNWALGLGLRAFGLAEEFDGTRDAGSAGRLQSMIYMGPLSRYPDNPEANVPPNTACGRNSVLTILGQEAGHRFGAYIRFLDPETNRRSTELLGRDAAHWSYYLHTDASFLEGNQIQDKGQGQSPRFETTEIVKRYSALDQYLMGLRSAEETPPTFLVRPPRSIDFPAAHPPQAGILFDGARFDVTVPMIVASEGPRLPPAAVSPRAFRFAFVLLVPAGSSPSAAEIAKLERIRVAWEPFFAAAVENRGRAESRLVKQLALSVWPAAGLIQGRSITATVSLAASATAPVTVALSASGGQVTVPGAVTIPAGQRSAEFPITANSTGVTELAARGPDDSFETARAQLSVRNSLAGLRIEQLWNLALSFGLILRAPEFESSGAPGFPLPDALIFRVRDENFLPYPGLRINAAPSGSGSVAPSALVTDGRGWVRLRWTLDRNPTVNTLAVSLDGQPDVNAQSKAGAAVQPARRREVRVPVEP